VSRASGWVLIASAAAAVALGAAAEVSAAEPQSIPLTPARARPAWSTLPVGAIPKPPSHDAALQQISKGESVAGLRVSREDGHPAHRVRAQVATENDGCLAGDVDLDLHRDPLARSSDSTVFLRLGVVTAVRSERLVRSADGAATLRIADVWVDPRTTGAKIAAETEIPLATLARGPAGAIVYGYRTEGGDLSMVVPTPNAPASPHSGASGRTHEGETVFARCGHIRVAVGGASGGSAAAAVPMELPAGARGEGSPAAMGELSVRASVAKLTRDPAPLISVMLSWEDSPLPPRPSMR
jgi:hypothetical protein